MQTVAVREVMVEVRCSCGRRHLSLTIVRIHSAFDVNRTERVVSTWLFNTMLRPPIATEGKGIHDVDSQCTKWRSSKNEPWI